MLLLGKRTNKKNRGREYIKSGLILDYHAGLFTGTGPGSGNINGQTWKDLSGNNRHGTPNNFPTSGVFTGGGSVPCGIQTDGVDDYIDATGTSGLSQAGDFSYEIWFSGTRAGTSEQLLFKNSSTGVGTVKGSFIVLRSSQPYIKFGVYDTSIKTNTQNVADPRDGKIHQLVGTKLSGGVYLFVDGAMVGFVISTIGDINNAVSLKIAGPSSLTQAKIHTTRWYGRALSLDEIKYNYSCGVLL